MGYRELLREELERRLVALLSPLGFEVRRFVGASRGLFGGMEWEDQYTVRFDYARAGPYPVPRSPLLWSFQADALTMCVGVDTVAGRWFQLVLDQWRERVLDQLSRVELPPAPDQDQRAPFVVPEDFYA